MKTNENSKLYAVRMLVTEAGKPVAWFIYDLGNGRGRKEVVDLETNTKVDSLTWTTRISYLRAEKPLDTNRADTGWKRVK